MVDPTHTQEIQLKLLRTAYRAAKTDAERSIIKQKAEAIIHPPTPEEAASLEKDVADSLMTLPDMSHPHWRKFAG